MEDVTSAGSPQHKVLDVSTVKLRPVMPRDFDALRTGDANWGDPFEFFGFQPTNSLERSYASDGLLTEDGGMLVVEAEGQLVGSVHWFPAFYGPRSASKAFRLGIALVPQARGKGHGTAAQRLLAEYLFATTNVNRLEAGTDSDNLAEQRALEKAGYHQEGVARQAQYRDGRYHDMVMFSRLRADE